MAIFNGMAVLIVRITFILLTYIVFRDINWRQLFSNRKYYLAQYACILLSISVGHVAGSFVLTIIELLQNLFLSSFYK
ncbi:DUF1146 family protein [Aerococcaceae bacterium WGS1372]